MFVYLCTYLYKSVDYSRSLSTPDVSEMCGALYKCIIIVDIITIQALVAEFIIISLRDDSRCDLYGMFVPYLMFLGEMYISNKSILQLSRSLSNSKYLRWRFQIFYFACIRRDLGRWQGEQCLGGIAGIPARRLPYFLLAICAYKSHWLA